MRLFIFALVINTHLTVGVWRSLAYDTYIDDFYYDTIYRRVMFWSSITAMIGVGMLLNYIEF